MGMFDFIGDAFNKDARNRQANSLKENKSMWQDFRYGQDAQEAAQSEAYDRLAQMGAEGGMDAGSRAALQQAQANNAQQAKASTDAALERAAASGRLTGGRALSAQMQAQQGAANSNAMAGTQAAADARQRAMQANATAGQAQNQINQFNANMRYNAQQQSNENRRLQTEGIERTNNVLADMNGKRVQQARDTAGAIGDGVMKAATAAATGGASLAGDAIGSVASGMGKAEGGMIDGKAPVPGDSEKNDIVPARLSPGEMVIPRSVVAKGPDAVREFALKLLRGEE